MLTFNNGRLLLLTVFKCLGFSTSSRKQAKKQSINSVCISGATWRINSSTVTSCSTSSVFLFSLRHISCHRTENLITGKSIVTSSCGSNTTSVSQRASSYHLICRGWKSVATLTAYIDIKRTCRAEQIPGDRKTWEVNRQQTSHVWSSTF